MLLSLIVAADENNVIGCEGSLPWDLPDDMKHFRETTEEHPVMMGRKTYDSIGRPLPRRRNIVITRRDIDIEGCDVVHSLDEALALVADEEEAFVIGGGEIYRQAMERADKIYLTRVHTVVENGDTIFPDISDEWEEISREEHVADENHAYAMTFLVFERRKSC